MKSARHTAMDDLAFMLAYAKAHFVPLQLPPRPEPRRAELKEAEG